MEQPKIVFHTDLDNTLIYSYKHELGADKRCVEVYHGREISFITAETERLLQQIKARENQIVMIPNDVPQDDRAVPSDSAWNR